MIGDHALEPPVLVLQGAQAPGLVDFEPAVLPPPGVEGLARDPVTANQLAGRGTGDALLQDGDDLLF